MLTLYEKGGAVTKDLTASCTLDPPLSILFLGAALPITPTTAFSRISLSTLPGRQRAPSSIQVPGWPTLVKT